MRIFPSKIKHTRQYSHVVRYARLLFLTTIIIPALIPATAGGQQDPGAEEPQRLRVFLDGNYFMLGSDYIRTEIDFVDWVRDRTDADVHIIVTMQGAGGGGRAYTIDFIGGQAFEERDDSLVYTSSQTDTNDETRSGVVRTMKIGLAPYLLRTPAGEYVDLSFRERRVRERPEMPERDPWNYWIFRTSLGGNVEGESKSKETSVNGSLSARRITEDWKLEFEVRGDYSENERELTDYTLTYYTHSLNYDGLIARSLDHGHWAAGIRTSASSSTRLNQYLTMRVAPILEYSFFPYSDFTRRQLTLQYSVGVVSYEYEEETWYGELEEKRFNESLRLALELTQPWGSVRSSLEGAHYFHEHEGKPLYHVNASANLDIRLVRGLSVNLNGRYARVHDQLYLKVGDYSDEEILLRLRKLQTSYEYSLRVGLSYTFGSIFNTIVNPRLQRAGRGGMDRYRR